MSKYSKAAVVAVVLLLFLGVVSYSFRDIIDNREDRTGTQFEPTAPALEDDLETPTIEPTMLMRELRVTPVGTIVTRTLSLTTTPVHIDRIDQDDTQ